MRWQITLLLFVALLAIAALMAIATCPTDYEFRQQLTRQVTGSDNELMAIVGGALTAKVVYVDDRVFYKVIRLRFNDRPVGYAFFGTVKTHL